jgi:phage/plasmid-associated DNA primase
MKTFKQLKQYLDLRPASNNVTHYQDGGWDDNDIQRDKDATLYGVESTNLKTRMQRAYKRNKRQKKIDRLQSTSEWPGLESFQNF